MLINAVADRPLTARHRWLITLYDGCAARMCTENTFATSANKTDDGTPTHRLI
jgi:hypothetical protein